MFRRRRRKYNGRWFPTAQQGIGVTHSPLTAATAAGQWTKTIDNSPMFLGDPDVAATMVGVSGTPLAGALGVGSAYVIQRIVGHIDVSMYQNQPDDSHCWVALGLYTSRVDQIGDPVDQAAWQILTDGSVAATPVVAAQSMMKRWLFRRIWHLGNTASNVAGRDAVFPPYSSGWITGANCGSHIDVRVKARVSYEERLWWQWEIVGGSNAGAIPAGTQVNVHVVRNVRMLAKPRMFGNR